MIDWAEFVRGPNGGVELNRLVGAVGALVFIVGAQIVTFTMDVGLTEYCIAFPGGLIALGLGVSGAVAIKDRNVASAKITAQTGRVPKAPPDGPPVPAGKPPPLDDPEAGQ